MIEVFDTTRQISADYNAAHCFFEGLLREPDQCRLEKEYPLVFSPQRMDQLLLLEREGDIKAGLATLPRLIQATPDLQLRALFVGSVVTNPEARRQGFQRQLFELLEERAQEDVYDLIILWSNQIEFYQKLGFVLGGLQASWFVEHKSAFGSHGHSAKVGQSSDVTLTEKHFQSFMDKRFCVKRTFEEQRLLWKIPRMKIAYTEKAYALLGKGEDFQGVCHEWAGPSGEVLDCLRALCESEESFRVLSPGVIHSADEMAVVAELEKGCVDHRLEYLGLIKVVSDRIAISGFDPESLKYPFFIWGLDSI